MNSQKIANRVGKVTIIWNVILSVAKFIAGIVGKSSAMISDSVHSLSDVISTIVAMIGIKIANKTSDDDHQYGHEKYECIASILLAFILFVTGISIALKGFEKFISGENIEPTYIALVAAIISIIVKELMYRYTIYYGNKINSVALKADAHHHRSDALSSIGAAIGIITSMIGFIYGDIIASFIIAIIICIEAVNIFKESMDKLVDKACDKSIITNIVFTPSQEDLKSFAKTKDSNGAVKVFENMVARTYNDFHSAFGRYGYKVRTTIVSSANSIEKDNVNVIDPTEEMETLIRQKRK